MLSLEVGEVTGGNRLIVKLGVDCQGRKATRREGFSLSVLLIPNSCAAIKCSETRSS